MQRRNSSELASGAVHGIGGALSYFAAARDEFDTSLWNLATQIGFRRMASDCSRSLSATYALCKLKASDRYGVDQRCRAFRAGRARFCRLGMPTRTREIQAGGSLAGKVSIKLSATSSVIPTVSISGKGRAFARPFRVRWCNVLGVFDISLKRLFRLGWGSRLHAAATAA